MNFTRRKRKFKVISRDCQTSFCSRNNSFSFLPFRFVFSRLINEMLHHCSDEIRVVTSQNPMSIQTILWGKKTSYLEEGCEKRFIGKNGSESRHFEHCHHSIVRYLLVIIHGLYDSIQRNHLSS